MSARLFAALDLPGDVVDALEGFAAAAAREGLRPVRRESVHVTLVFLGHRPEEDVAGIAEAVMACAAPVPGLRLAGAAWLPPRRPRVLAVDLEDGDGACGHVQACVSDALAAVAGHRPEARPFRPHVTVGRVRKGARVHLDLPDPPAPLEFAAEALTLYRSRLAGGGARYEAVARAALP